MRTGITFFSIIAILLADTLLTKLYAFTNISNSFSYESRILVYFIIALAYCFGVYFLMQLVKIQGSQIIKKRLHLKILHKILLGDQFLLGVIIFSLLFQMITTSRYSLTLTALGIATSYITAIVILSIFSYRFFSWFRSNRNNVVFSYALSSIVLVINASITVSFVLSLLLNTPPYISEHKGLGYSPFILQGSLTDILNRAYIITSILSFVLWWFSTAMLLRHYSQRLGKEKYWIIIALPLSYFLMQFLPSLPELLLIFPNANDIFLIYTITFTLSKPIGGLLFGAAFWIIVRSFNHDNIVRQYIVISAFGIILLFVSNQAIVLVNFSYPPFGLVTICFFGLSSYLVLIGLYSSAISVSQDRMLRNTIRRYAVNQSKLLDNIGFSQMEHEISRQIMKVSKEKEVEMEQESGIRSSIDEENVKEYLKIVLNEIKDKKDENTKKL